MSSANIRSAPAWPPPESRTMSEPHGGRSATARRVLPWLAEAERIDIALYDAVAGTPTPHLDVVMRRLSTAANYSRLSLAASAVLARAGGRAGRRAATSGLASLAVTTTFVNLVVKPLSRRRRPTTEVQSS